MKAIREILALAVILGGVPAFGEFIVLKSGKTMQGEIVARDRSTVSVRLDSGEIKINWDTIEQILPDADAAKWKEEHSKSSEEEAALEQGTDLTIIDKDQPVVREKTLQEIGAEGKQLALDKLVEGTRTEGNAAQYYWVVLDADHFQMSRVVSSSGGQVRWNFDDPIFEQIREAARLRDCNFYPVYLPYPAGTNPPEVKFNRLLRIAEGMIARGQEKAGQENFDEARRDFESALIMGEHLEQNAPILRQFANGIMISTKAGRALSEFYLKQADSDRYWRCTEYVKNKEKQLESLNIRMQGLKFDFNGAKIEALMDNAKHGNQVILRGYAMSLLNLIRMAAEQQPLNKSLFDKIPLESHQPFNSIAPGVNEKIGALFREIEKTDESDFLRSHAAELLSMNALKLAPAVNKLLGN